MAEQMTSATVRSTRIKHNLIQGSIAEVICSAISIRPAIRSHFYGVKLTPYGRPNAYGRTDDFSLWHLHILKILMTLIKNAYFDTTMTLIKSMTLINYS